MTTAIGSKATMAVRAAALATALALAACSGSEVPPEQPAEAADAAPKSSSAGLPAGDIQAGQKLAAIKSVATGQSCLDCHGPEGNRPIDPTYPRLGGQYADYLAYALQQYRADNRDNALMGSQAKPLTDQQIADLAEYFGSRPGTLRDLKGAHD